MPKVDRKAPESFHFQTMMFEKQHWSKEKAEEYLEQKKQPESKEKMIKSGFHETDRFYRYRQYDTDQKKFRYFHKDLGKGLAAVCGSPKNSK